jgi:hypothetical protein
MRLDACPRLQQDALDASVGCRRQPPRILGHQRADAAHLPHDRSAADGVQENRGTFDSRRRRLHAGQSDRDRHHHQRGNDHQAGAPQAAALEDRRVARQIRHSAAAGRSKGMPRMDGC